MAQRCQNGPHGNCVICERFVAPTQLLHNHVFGPEERGGGLICATCHGCIALAAKAVLRGIQAAHIQWDSEDTLEAILQHYVVIGIQLDLIAPASRSN